VSSAGLRPKSGCSSKAQKQLYSNLQSRPLVREGATKLQTRNCLKEISRRKKNWSRVPDGRLTPGQTGRLTVGRNLAATATRPPLWSSGQSFWLHRKRSGLDSRRYHTFWEVVGLERGPISLVGTTEELLERKNSDSGLETREYARRDSSRWPRGTLYPQKLALTSSTSGGPSFGIFLSWLMARSLVYFRADCHINIERTAGGRNQNSQRFQRYEVS
jgi:hypothetical protein